MSVHTLLVPLFRYEASVDRELLDALASLPENEASDGFGQALRVLNHAHIVDRIFAANLQGQRHACKRSWMQEAPALSDLTAAVTETGRWYLDYVSKITAEELEEIRDFIFTDGGNGRMSREEMLAHVVTHGGYHRGKAGQILPKVESTAMRDVFAGYLRRPEPQRRQ